jgi:RNA polymerase sigma-70 factor (ECF subfamily)
MTGDPRTDEQLLAAHVSGEIGAFDELIRRHQHYLWAVARRTSQTPDDAAEALQEALLNAHVEMQGGCRKHAGVLVTNGGRDK